MNQKNDEYSYSKGNYNGVDCKWPLTCDRRVFPYYCNNSDYGHQLYFEYEAEDELTKELNKLQQTQIKKLEDSNIKPTPEAIAERIKLLKFQKSPIDISLILPYVEHNYKQRMMSYNNNRQKNNKRNSKNKLSSSTHTSR